MSASHLVNPLRTLAEKYYSLIENGDKARKPDNYLDLYDTMLSCYKNHDINILEIGIYSGASTLIWHDYFEHARLVGIDIMDRPSVTDAIVESGRFHFIQGDQCDDAVLRAAVDATNGAGFDIIIDDASHIGDYARRSFDFLFTSALKRGGLYFIEDFHTGYMGSWADGHAFIEPTAGSQDGIQSAFASHEYGMVGWLKQLFDQLHTEEHGNWLMPGRRMYPMESFLIIPYVFVVKKRG